MAASPLLYSAYAGLQPSYRHQGDGGTTPSGKTSDPVSNGRLCDITQYWLSDNEPGDCALTGQIASSRASTQRRFGDNSLLLRRNVYSYTTDRKPELQLEIQSDHLQRIFRQVAPHLRTTNVHANPIIIKAPYHELYHFRNEVADAGPSPDSPLSAEAKGCQADLDVLQKFVDETLGQAIAEIEALKSSRKTSMEYLWAIFKPGELVLLRRQGSDGQLETCCGILQSYYTKKDEAGNPIWCLKVQNLAFENGCFGVVEQEHQFELISGQVDILTLPAYPLEYCTDPEGIKSDLARRGRVFIGLCQSTKGDGVPIHMAYEGPVWIQRKRWERSGCEFFDSPERMVRQSNLGS